MSLFQQGKFTLHSGGESFWRIDCDDMTDAEIGIFARIIAAKVGAFASVDCPPSHFGSAAPRLAEAMRQYKTYIPLDPILIVDDVLTTGSSMEETRQKYIVHLPERLRRPIIGAVMFARGECPDWVYPVWRLNP